QRIGIASRKRKKKFRQPPIRADRRKNLLMLYLSRHHRAAHAGLLKSFDEFGEFTEREPAHGRRTGGFDLRKSFFFDRRDYDFKSLRTSGVQHEKREFAVARDETETLHSCQLLVVSCQLKHFKETLSVRSELSLLQPRGLPNHYIAERSDSSVFRQAKF